MLTCWKITVLPVLLLVLVFDSVHSANKEPTDSRKAKGVRTDPIVQDPGFVASEPVIATAADLILPPLIPIHHDASLIPIAQDAVNTIVQNKIADNLALEPWEPIARLPDHEVMIDPAKSSPVKAPSMHMDAGGIPTGVSDFLLDTAGGLISQTYFGNRNAETDDDDWNDDYDDDIHEKSKSDDHDDDDDDKDDDRKDFKPMFRPRMAPLMAAPRTPGRPAALLHRPMMGSRIGSLHVSNRLNPGSSGPDSIPVSVSQARLVVPQSLSLLRNSHVLVHRTAPVSSITRFNNYLMRPLRILYD